jgi:hypothetical protein
MYALLVTHSMDSPDRSAWVCQQAPTFALIAAPTDGQKELVAMGLVRDFDGAIERALSGNSTNETQAPQDLFGPMWTDDLVEQMPVVQTAMQRFKSTIDKRADLVQVRWHLVNTTFPKSIGVQMSMLEWNLTQDLVLLWSDVSSVHRLTILLLKLWDNILKDRISAVREEAASAGAE